MEKYLARLRIIFDELSIPANPDNRNTIILQQKSVYLLQIAGLDMGYSFGWYINGPYCPELAKDQAQLKYQLDAKNDENSDWKVKQRAKETITKIKPFIT